ncbi:hypothetical protein SmJEL517_g00016 [Synchytrium microbalum]|uniref:HSF-type DNA-binding domain-containing protein n=1 Tax=Synchytrium microbalum TaxID=1806994 RepID=A0A507CAY9_9FUNG|nr:uncharacterized protein SmJEL517_g00016 [Synchytrium microbalum]TPX38227.1 hypothetical protein SmJEL517_g00016 [Synchytrium microbalum]
MASRKGTKRTRGSSRNPTPPAMTPEQFQQSLDDDDEQIMIQRDTQTALLKQHIPSSSAKTVPAFLNKLYNMVSDSTTNDLIHWSADGTSFIVQRHEEFAKDVLPRFFKHNNFSSFVRQLNMYGFHKVPHLQQGALHADTDAEMWEFTNQYFQRNQPDLLSLVSRKKGRDGEEKEISTGGSLDLNNLVTELAAVKRHQLTISSDLKTIQQENQLLWNESQTIRARYQKQQDTIDKIVRFLGTVFNGKKQVLSNGSGPSQGTGTSSPNKRRRLMIEQGANDLAVSDSDGDGEFEDTIRLSPDHDQDVQQRVADLMTPHFSLTDPLFPGAGLALSPTALGDNNALIPNATPPTMTSGLSTNNPSYLLNHQQAVNSSVARTADTQADLDLLQDHLDSITDQLGFDPDHNVDFIDTLLRDGPTQPIKGTPLDRDTLLALINSQNGMPNQPILTNSTNMSYPSSSSYPMNNMPATTQQQPSYMFPSLVTPQGNGANDSQNNFNFDFDGGVDDDLQKYIANSSPEDFNALFDTSSLSGNGAGNFLPPNSVATPQNNAQSPPSPAAVASPANTTTRRGTRSGRYM